MIFLVRNWLGTKWRQWYKLYPMSKSEGSRSLMSQLCQKANILTWPFVFYLRPQWFGWCQPTLGKAICFILSINSNVELNWIQFNSNLNSIEIEIQFKFHSTDSSSLTIYLDTQWLSQVDIKLIIIVLINHNTSRSKNKKKNQANSYLMKFQIPQLIHDN